MSKVHEIKTVVDGKDLKLPVHFDMERRFFLPKQEAGNQQYNDLMGKNIFTMTEYFPNPEQLETYVTTRLEYYDSGEDKEHMLLVNIQFSTYSYHTILGSNPGQSPDELYKYQENTSCEGVGLNIDYEVVYRNPYGDKIVDTQGRPIDEDKFHRYFLIPYTVEREKSLIQLMDDINNMVGKQIYNFFGKTNESMAQTLDNQESLFEL